MYTGSLTKTADAALATQHLLVKFGSDADHIAVAGATDKPIGACVDAPDAGDGAAVHLLGSYPGSITMVASGTIAVGADVFAAAAGKVAATGTIMVGRALTAGAANAELEVDACVAAA